MHYTVTFHTNGAAKALLSLLDANEAHVMSGDTCNAITNFPRPRFGL